ncbi:MAG: hypothetical protein RLZZ179_133 [Verrucomicrobiota bacterium]|jgi:hypothetical protein
MSSEARVRSVEALGDFRSHLIVFLSRSTGAVSKVTDEVKRARLWLETEQRTFWEGRLRRATRSLEQAQAELMTAKLSSFKDSVTMQEMEVRKAKRAVEEATEKLKRIRHWVREFDQLFAGHLRRLDSMSDYLVHDLPKGVAYLERTQRLLEDYVDGGGVRAPRQAPPDPAAGQES